MASIRGSVKQTDVNVSKFLGLYEAEDGDTQMKYGVSPDMNNFQITENFHLKTRPGIVPYYIMDGSAVGRECIAYYADEAREIAVFTTGATNTVYSREAKAAEWESLGTISVAFTAITQQKKNFKTPSIFMFGERYYILTGAKFYSWAPGDESVSEVEGYVPLIVTGAAPSGGGTSLERVNLLTDKRRVQYSADGASDTFVLPEELAKGASDSLIESVTVDGIAVAWTEIAEPSARTYAAKLSSAPSAGTNNVEITYKNLQNAAEKRALIEKMRFAETFNGATDTRLFVYGDGGNIIYYSEPTLAGAVTGAYFPSLNEIKIGDNSSGVTGLCRHYGRMMAFKPDSCYAVAYDTITLADGTLTAGFYVRSMHRSLGSDALGQLAVVQNFPRTFCEGSLYDWKQTASYYQDERYARIASEAVQFSVRDAKANNIFLYDDDIRHRFYCFLNDEDGTVLVNAYEQNVWFRYTGFCNVRAAGRRGGKLILAMRAFNQCNGLYELSNEHTYDYIPVISATDGAQRLSGYTRKPISCTWESGHMDFGKSNMRKYSSYIWVTLAPGREVRAWISARSDRRAEYAEKRVDNQVTGLFDETDFADFSFETYAVPRARRLKIKVKKFVYYKLLLRCEGAASVTVQSVPESAHGEVTVLSVDQRIRFTSDAK